MGYLDGFGSGLDFFYCKVWKREQNHDRRNDHTSALNRLQNPLRLFANSNNEIDVV